MPAGQPRPASEQAAEPAPGIPEPSARSAWRGASASATLAYRIRIRLPGYSSGTGGRARAGDERAGSEGSERKAAQVCRGGTSGEVQGKEELIQSALIKKRGSKYWRIKCKDTQIWERSPPKC